MRVRTVLVILVLLLLAVFVTVNWPAFMAPTTLSLLVTRVEAPLGLVLLGMQVLVLGAFTVYIAMWQGAVLLQNRRHTKELQAQRALADQAEASRFTELRASLHGEFEQLRQEIRDHANSVAASIGELDERLQAERKPAAAP
ncbi:MAG TPA: LapA family protein [Burkholderiaceae bacterium]|nr:LapA family protein [Burkholderiaceae bacterium]